MSQHEPAFYNLEFFGDAAFWEGAGDAPRRTFLMPLANPAEFLAFGVFGPSTTVHFVARGRVQDHLGDFLASMRQAGATTELYERVPLPWPLVKRYASDDPFEGTDTDPPKNTTNGGRISYAGGAGTTLWNSEPLDIAQQPQWPKQATTREAYILPLSGGTEFLALGVSRAPDWFIFVGRGTAGAQCEDFINRMQQAGVRVERSNWPPLVFLRTYLTQKYPNEFTAPPQAA